MGTLMFAGQAEICVDRLCDLVPSGFTTELQDKVSGIRHLIVGNGDKLFMQIQAFDEESDADTMDDFARSKDLPAAFATALEKRVLRFLLLTYNSEDPATIQPVIDAFAAVGAIEFDCSDDVRVLQT